MDTGAYTYDGNGNRLTRTVNGVTESYAYDDGDKLLNVSVGGNVVKSYGFDGGRRWRKDLANNTWDWYPCGVACCAGDLVTLRSTDGGTTWSTLEKRLDKAVVLNSSPFLPSVVSGNQRINNETILTDSFGAVRAGSYGEGMKSLLLRYRGDSGVEADLLALNVSMVTSSGKPGLDCLNACWATCEGMTGGKYAGCIAGCRTGCYIFIKKGCDALWNACFRLPNNHQINACLTVYVNVCSGQ